LDARQRRGWSVKNATEVVAPAFEFNPQGGQVNPAVPCGASFELPRSLVQERTESGTIVARVMVEGGGHLNQSVEEQLFIPGGFQPHTFERLVGLEEFLRVE
jgi:riboflavin biosynthesis pyrimidine reductase